MVDANKLRQWQVVGANLGEALVKLDGSANYTQSDIKDLHGVNLGGEWSEFHRCVIVSKAKYNYGDTVLLIPLTTFKKGSEKKSHLIEIEVEKSTERFIKRKSCLVVTGVRCVTKKRISKIYGFLPRKYVRKVKEGLSDVLDIFEKM